MFFPVTSTPNNSKLKFGYYSEIGNYLILEPKTLNFSNLGFVPFVNLIQSTFTLDCFVVTPFFTGLPLRGFSDRLLPTFNVSKTDFTFFNSFKLGGSLSANLPKIVSGLKFSELNNRFYNENSINSLSAFSKIHLLFQRHHQYLEKIPENISTEIGVIYDDKYNYFGLFDDLARRNIKDCFLSIINNSLNRNLDSCDLIRCGTTNYYFNLSKGVLYSLNSEKVATLIGYFAVKSENITYVSQCLKTGAIIHKDALVFVVDEKIMNTPKKYIYVKSTLNALIKETNLNVVTLNFDEFTNKINLPRILNKRKEVLDNFLKSVSEKFNEETNNLPFYLID